jgi:hypothetical protein
MTFQRARRPSPPPPLSGICRPHRPSDDSTVIPAECWGMASARSTMDLKTAVDADGEQAPTPIPTNLHKYAAHTRRS